jgi:type VI secretion system lysozyme-like protein
MNLSENTLFERLRDERSARDPSMSLDRSRLGKSIANNLQRIFSSREMHAPAQLDYGMPDPNTILHAPDGGSDLLRNRLKAGVELYEPRIKGVRVLHLESTEIGHDIQFVIQGSLVSEPPEKITFTVSITANGHITVTA